MLIERGTSYEKVCQKFQWKVPEKFNIADYVCDRWADDKDRVALVYEDENKRVHRYSFADVQRHANRFANTLLSSGLAAGDRVMLLLAQDPECAISHLGCFKAGIVSSPTSVLFGTDAILYRLNDSGASAVVTDMANLGKVLEVKGDAPNLQHVFVIDGESEQALPYWPTIEKADDQFTNVDSNSEDTAWICYTSGTTGLPKGSVQPHRMLLGHIPSLEFSFDFFPQDHDVLWSPADWAWMAGLADILLPGWFHGCTVVATAMKGFEPEEAYRVLDQHEVTLALLTPTMLKLMRQVPDAKNKYDLTLRAVISGGESVGTELFDWAEGALNIKINEVFGQTECNVILGNNANVMPIKPGSIGKPMPGTICAIIDDDGNELPPGQEGHIGCKRPHPVMLKEYLNKPEATREKFIGDWLITGDSGYMDEDGYFWFRGRADDVITSSGYRIGPGEIEDALLKHEAVQMAVAIGVPDPVRTEVVKAFVIPTQGTEASDELAEELRSSLRERLAKHEVPKTIEFVDSLPMTTTGKIIRRELRERETQKTRTQ